MLVEWNGSGDITVTPAEEVQAKAEREGDRELADALRDINEHNRSVAARWRRLRPHGMNGQTDRRAELAMATESLDFIEPVNCRRSGAER